MDLPKIAECPVCLELFTEPKVLSCGHCFCKKCINAAPRGFTGQLKVNCPECRQESSVPAAGFPTNYRLLDIVSNLESAGFRNTKECGGCGRKTPKAELFSCTSCQAEIGNAHEVIICSLCFMNAHKAHDFVRYNKATQRDVDQARNNVSCDGRASQVRVDEVREELHEMTVEVMQALEARAPKHVEIYNELEGALRADASKDDIEAKVDQSSQYAAETAKISLEMGILVQSFRRQLKECIQKKGEVSLAATAKPAADQPSTSAAAARPPREPTMSDAMHAWEYHFDHYGGAADVAGWMPMRYRTEDPGQYFAERNASPPPRSSTYSPTPPRNSSTSPFYSVTAAVQPTAPSFSSTAATVHVRPSPGAWWVAPAPSPPRTSLTIAPQPSSQATSTRFHIDTRSNIDRMARRLEEIVNEARRDPLLPGADGAASAPVTASPTVTASSSGTAAVRIIPQEPARGRSPPRDPRSEVRPGTSAVMLISSDEEDFNARAEVAARTRLKRTQRKRPYRDADN